MTYYNLIYRAGHERMAGLLAEAGVSGAIIPDLPLEELGPWAEAADAAGVATVLLVAPSTPPARIEAICRRSRGFVYGVGRMGVTGEQATLADSAREVASRIGAVTDVPVCIGIGVSSPEQAATVCEVADGVVVGSALVRRLLEGEGPVGAATFVSSLRRALRRLSPTGRRGPGQAAPACGRRRGRRNRMTVRTSGGRPRCSARCSRRLRISSRRSWRSRKVTVSVGSVKPMAAR